MRRLALASTLFLAACATAPQSPVPQPVSPAEPRGLIGLTPTEVVEHFGNPALQVREGTSLKLQFRGRVCVLDAYFYPSGSGSAGLRVTHVDTRSPAGTDYNQAACISALENPS